MMNRDMYSQTQKRDVASEQERKVGRKERACALYQFSDIEDVIQLSHRLTLPYFNTRLFGMDNKYWLIIEYPHMHIRKTKDWFESIILEYGERGKPAVEYVFVYGNEIFSENAVGTMQQYFPQLGTY